MNTIKEKYNNYDNELQLSKNILTLEYVGELYHYTIHSYYDSDNEYIKEALSIYNEMSKYDIVKYQKKGNKDYKELIKYYEGLNDVYNKENHKR